MTSRWLAVVLALGSSVSAAYAAPVSTMIRLNSILLDTARPPAVPEPLQAKPGGIDGNVALVQFPGPITAKQRAALDERALRVYTYLPDNAFLVRLPAGSTAVAASEIGASWVGVYHPFYKISADVAAVAAPEVEGRAPRVRSVFVQVYPDANLDEVVQQIRDLGLDAKVAGSSANPFFSRVRLLLTDAEMVRFRKQLATLADVFWIDLEPRRALLNDTTIWVGQSGLSAGMTTPIFSRNIFGEGQTIAVLDTGIDADMCFFRDTARGLPPTNACNGGTVVDTAQRKVIAVDFLWQTECNGGITSTEWDTQDHGTHVSGTAAGDNFANVLTHNTADGMAPGAKLVMQDAGYLVDNCGDLPGIGCPVVDLNPLFQQTYDQGARFHSNSWGDNENATVQNNYSAGSQDVDEFMWNHKDFLILFAAGNSGPGTASVGSPSTAKNGLSVGATQRSTAANSMASFSSCGPTSDGRLKPDITVPGQSIISANADNNTASNNCDTKSSSGTSMATPGAAGFAALTRQYYSDGFYPSGAANSTNAFTPSAALVRATMINSAINMTVPTAIPSNCQGWGRVLLDDALFFPGDTRKLWAKDDPGFATGSTATKTFTFTVVAGQSFKATLAWTDFPSTPAASIHLINDLDLTVSGPSGTFLGNVFASGASTTGGAADRRNTLEQVLVASPAAGTYTVTVKAFNIPQGTEPFALVVTGNATEAGGNQSPIANAGPDQNVGVNATVTLNGSASSDPDGGPNPLTYAWSQVSGPAATITNPTSAMASFVAASAGTYVFQLQVSDGAASATDTVSIVASTGPVTVFFDDFETNKGWTTNPLATDTATTGQWERGDPEATTDTGARQLGTTVSGLNDLVTARLAGASAGANDIDGGTTTIQSPAIVLPSTGTLTLTFSYYFSHSTNSSSADFFRVQVVGTTTTQVLQELGAATGDNAAWATGTANISAFAGQTVRILISAADASTASLVEAGVDDVKIVQQ
ncbi:MAG: S8 family serine peptidase [Acidobacteriota bacterium]